MADYEHSDTGNWNLSSPYVEHLAKLFIEADAYNEIAQYGFTDIIMDLQTKDVDKVILRYRGLEKYIFKLKKIIMYSWFAMNSSTQKEKFLDYHKELQALEDESLGNIIVKVQSGMKSTNSIDEDMFKLVFREVEKIDMTMRAPMKEADLIFMHKESFDPVEYKKKVIDSFKEGM